MQKCDLCLERWPEKKLPMCVTACPMRALDAGHMEELRSRYGEKGGGEGSKYSAPTRPSIIIRSVPRLIGPGAPPI